MALDDIRYSQVVILRKILKDPDRSKAVRRVPQARLLPLDHTAFPLPLCGLLSEMKSAEYTSQGILDGR